FRMPEEFSASDTSQVVIVPCPYEADSPYGKGTKGGPKAIYEASQRVELFDEELWTEPYRIGIHSHKEVKLAASEDDGKAPFKGLYDALKPLVWAGKFPIVLGGEHSITIGSVATFAQRFTDLSVLQLNAHADCHKSFAGNEYNDACVTYQLYNNVLENPVI